jgi:Kdo2-lipid IVA lauroyltransferase/acyltransferase
MKRIGYWFTRFFIELFRFVPFSVLYVLSDVLAWLMARVYRPGVVMSNLRRAYPDKTAAELRQIAAESYRNVADVTLETLKSFTMPPETVLSRIDYVNPELINNYLWQGKPVLITGGHLCNWEWLALTMGLTIDGISMATYKKISNPHMEKYVRDCRARGKLLLLTMEETFAKVRDMNGQPFALILGSDQSPSNPDRSHWVDFMGIRTAFLPGTEVLSRRFGAEVTYFIIERTARGRYRMVYKDINPHSDAELAVTRAFAEALEADINRRPADWLWTHKRWKLNDRLDKKSFDYT